MALAGHLRRLLAYDDWANRETAAALRAAGDPASRPLALLAHVAAAERLWLDRLRGSPQTMPVWPTLTLAECELELAELPARWREYLAELGPDDLDRQVAYTNTKGEAWENTVLDIVTHVVLHSAYHRGQIGTALRASGAEPAQTDYIVGARRRYIE